MSYLPEVLAVIEEEAAKAACPRDLALAVGLRLAGTLWKKPSQL